MRIKVLGSSSSGNCYLLQSKKETLILELGVPYKNILNSLGYVLNEVVGCLVTHEHKDHSKSAKDLLKAGIDVYMSKGTMEACKLTGHRLKILESEKAVKIGEFIVLPFEVQHDATEPLGFLIYHKEMGNLLFITDSYYCKYKFPDLDLIFIECNYSNEIIKENGLDGMLINRLMKSHFELENVKNYLKAMDLNRVKEIVLLHLSDNNSDASAFKEKIQRATGKPVHIARKGMEVHAEVR